MDLRFTWWWGHCDCISFPLSLSSSSSILHSCHEKANKKRMITVMYGGASRDGSTSTQFLRISFSKSKHFQFMMLSHAVRRSYAWRLFAMSELLISVYWRIFSPLCLDKATKYSRMRFCVRCTWLISFTSDYFWSASHKYPEWLMWALRFVCGQIARMASRCPHKFGDLIKFSHNNNEKEKNMLSIIPEQRSLCVPHFSICCKSRTFATSIHKKEYASRSLRSRVIYGNIINIAEQQRVLHIGFVNTQEWCVRVEKSFALFQFYYDPDDEFRSICMQLGVLCVKKTQLFQCRSARAKLATIYFQSFFVFCFRFFFALAATAAAAFNLFSHRSL